MYKIDKLETVFIGYQGENETRTIAINVSSWIDEFPQGHIAILHSRPTEQNPYIVANATVNNGILEWVVNGADVGIAGMGYAVVQMSYNEQVLKTAVFTTKIGKTLDGTISPTPTPPAPSWVTDILNSRAEQFNINEQGHLIVTKVDGTTEDLGQVVGGGSSAVTSVNNKTGDVVLDAIDVSAGLQLTGDEMVAKLQSLPLNTIIQCKHPSRAFNRGYFYRVSGTGTNRRYVQQQVQEWHSDNRKQDRFQFSGVELANDDLSKLLTVGDIVQCTSDFINPPYANYIKGYFYRYGGGISNFTQTDVQPTSGGAVDSVNGKTGAVVLTASDVGALPDNTPIPTKTSDLQNDSGFITDDDTLAVGSVEVDNAPAKNSNNLITSGAVFGAVNPNYELIEKIIIGYSITTQEPVDWSTNYTDYFTNTGTAREPVYTAVTGESAPTWQSGTYYSYQSGGVQILDVYKEPDGTDYSFKHLYLTFEQGGSSSINGAFFFATALYPNLSATGGEHYGGFVTQMNASTPQKHIIRAGINGNLGYYFNWYGAYNRMSDYSDQPILSAQETAITGWRLRRTSNGALLSGTAIYVYGVR